MEASCCRCFFYQLRCESQEAAVEVAATKVVTAALWYDNIGRLLRKQCAATAPLHKWFRCTEVGVHAKSHINCTVYVQLRIPQVAGCWPFEGRSSLLCVHCTAHDYSLQRTLRA